MLILKIVAVVLGLAFTVFGYFIYFRKKYNLINGFEADFKAGRKDENYVERVGLVEFVLGTAILIAGIALIIFACAEACHKAPTLPSAATGSVQYQNASEPLRLGGDSGFVTYSFIMTLFSTLKVKYQLVIIETICPVIFILFI